MLQRGFFGGLMLAAVAGCYPELPTVSGIAIVSVDDERFTMDTGNGGKKAAGATGATITADCNLGRGFLGLFLVHREADFKQFQVFNEPGNPGINAEIGGVKFEGSCPISLQVHDEDPYEADVTAAPCELRHPFDGKIARLESLALHVKNCAVDTDD